MGISRYRFLTLCLIFITFLLIVYQLINISTHINTGICIPFKQVLDGLLQNDTNIINYIRLNHLIPPSTLPYNLSQPDIDPGSYHGQNAVIKKIFKNMKGGFFVDAGAHDGEYISNTLKLETDFNWTGLLVEPSPYELPNLFNKHRKAWIADVCLSPERFPSKLDFFHRINYTIASKLVSDQDRNEIFDETYGKIIKVPCFPIFSILSAMEISVVDYFSLDVEGVELEVLENIPFDEIFIKVFSVEYNLIPRGTVALVEFMTSKGYNFVAEAYHDYIFAHKTLNYSNDTYSQQ